MPDALCSLDGGEERALSHFEVERNTTVLFCSSFCLLSHVSEHYGSAQSPVRSANSWIK